MRLWGLKCKPLGLVSLMCDEGHTFVFAKPTKKDVVRAKLPSACLPTQTYVRLPNGRYNTLYRTVQLGMPNMLGRGIPPLDRSEIGRLPIDPDTRVKSRFLKEAPTKLPK